MSSSWSLLSGYCVDVIVPNSESRLLSERRDLLATAVPCMGDHHMVGGRAPLLHILCVEPIVEAFGLAPRTAVVVLGSRTGPSVWNKSTTLCCLRA